MNIPTTRKLMLIGDGGVGKSSLIHWLKVNSFNMKYIPTEYTGIHRVDYAGQSWEIIDTSGQGKYGDRYMTNLRQITTPDHVMVMYDCTSRLSYRSVEPWVKSIKNTFGDQVPITVLANKVDIRYKQINPSESHVQISCKTGQGIQDLFGVTSY